MAKEYVKLQDGTYRFGDTRVSPDSIVYAYDRGASPESIQLSFTTLTLEQIRGALAFYLAHRSDVDKYLRVGEREFDRLRQAQRAAHPDWYEKLNRAREERFAAS